MSGRGRDRGAGKAAVLALALLLGACGGPSISTDEFSTVTTIDSPFGATNPLLGPKIEWQIESSVAKAAPHEVEHRVLARIVSPATFFKSDQHETARVPIRH